MKYQVVYADQMKVGKAGQHLVCADLLRRNLDAFLTDEGLGYDVLVDADGTLKRIQVKTTTARKYKGKAKDVYRFYLRTGKGSFRAYSVKKIDIVAFVFLDIKRIAYVKARDLISAITGDIVQCVDFTSRGHDRGLLRAPRHEVRTLEDYTLARALGGDNEA